MPDFFARAAMLPTGWADDVAITTDEDGTITAVKTGARAGRGAVRLPGAVMPGMANLHSHAFQRAMAGLAEQAGKSAEDSFWTWRDVMYRFLARLDPAQVGAIAAQLYVEMLKAGYTSVAEFHYLHHQPNGKPYEDEAEMARRVIGAAEKTGIGITILPVLYAYAGFGCQPAAAGQKRFVNGADRFLRIYESLAHRHAGDPQVRVGIAPHSLRAVSKGLLSETITGVDRIDATAPIHVHIAEQTKEVDDCLAWSNVRPVTWLYGNFGVDERWCLIHATHINRMETWMIAHSQAVAGICPTTEANLGDGIFPLGLYLRGEGRFGIGSDSHISVSPVEELRWLEYVQRLRRERRNIVVGAKQRHVGMTLWQGALRGGAQALGRPVGGIARGNRCDLVALDTDSPVLAGRSGATLTDSFVFSGNQSLVTDVVVGGRQVVTGGRHKDEDRIARAYRKAIGELTA